MRILSGFCLLLVLVTATACGSLQSEASYPDPERDNLYKHGSLLGEEGFVLFGEGRDRDKEENTGIGVNGFLWRASLDTVSFMPIASADPFGGVILTDWYSAPENPGERSKLNIHILDRQLRADGVRVSVFRQQQDENGNWADVPVSPETARTLEDTILTRARQMRVAIEEEGQE
ncbi:MAG: DUF3576 domain-containing protein [Pseudomonadota bacterium]|nr:DUF3576 domain-containing protein [Pseudomonadota bacterium]